MIYPPESLFLRVTELESALCDQDKLLYKVFCENKKLNLELESASFEIASLRSVRDNKSAKPCDNCKMIMVNYADLWLVHSHIASLLDSAKLELRELKATSKLLGAWTNCPLLRSDLEACVIQIKDLTHQITHSSCYSVLSPPCDACGSLNGKLFHATKEIAELKYEVAYLTSHLERTVLSEKIIEEDLSRVEESATKSTYKLGVGFERCEKKGEKSAPKFVPNKTHYPSNPKSSFNPKKEVKRETPSQKKKLLFACFMAVLVTWMSFAFVTGELRGYALSMLETHIVMSSLIFHLILTLVLHLTLLLVLCLISSITHMVLVHERTASCLDALVAAHVLIVVIISCIGMVFCWRVSYSL
jgi:hypothetical protein